MASINDSDKRGLTRLAVIRQFYGLVAPKPRCDSAAAGGPKRKNLLRKVWWAVVCRSDSASPSACLLATTALQPLQPPLLSACGCARPSHWRARREAYPRLVRRSPCTGPGRSRRPAERGRGDPARPRRAVPCPAPGVALFVRALLRLPLGLRLWAKRLCRPALRVASLPPSRPHKYNSA